MLPRLLAAYKKYGFSAFLCDENENQRCNKGAQPEIIKKGAPIVLSIKPICQKVGFSRLEGISLSLIEKGKNTKNIKKRSE